MKESFAEIEAADYLGLTPATLRKSRSTGLLGGRLAPPFRKIGRSVRYPIAELEAWLQEAPLHNNTAQCRQYLGNHPFLAVPKSRVRSPWLTSVA